MYDSYFEEMEIIFKHLDFQKRQKIRKDDLMSAAYKLRDEAIGPHELRVPPAIELERLYKTMTCVEEGCLNFDEFQLLMFKATLEDD